MGLKVKAIESSVSSVSVSCDSIRLKFLMIVLVTMLQKYTFFAIITKIPSFFYGFCQSGVKPFGAWYVILINS